MLLNAGPDLVSILSPQVRAYAGVSIVDMEDMSTTSWSGSNGAMFVLSVIVTVTVTQSSNVFVTM